VVERSCINRQEVAAAYGSVGHGEGRTLSKERPAVLSFDALQLERSTVPTSCWSVEG